MPLFIDKYQFRELFGFSKANSDLIFGNLKGFKNFQEERHQEVTDERVETVADMINKIKASKAPLYQKENRQSFYEILTNMSVMSYANYYNKIRFIFCLFDFDGNRSIDLDEIALMIICFLEGWKHITKIKMPERRVLEKVAEIIY